MKIECIKCLPEAGSECSDFSPSEKKELSIIDENSLLEHIVYLRERYHLSLKHAKYIVIHINDKTGNCNRCSFDNLIGDCVSYPQYGAFNFNWR